MKNKIRPTIAIILITSLFSYTASAQTNGILTLSMQLASHSGKYGTSHVVAIWIQDASNAFVKTNLRMAKTNHTINNHLSVWKSKSNLNTVDAIT